MFRPALFNGIVSLTLFIAPSATAAQGAVYVASNDPGENEVLVFGRSPDGRLAEEPESFATGGAGTGSGLGNQGGVLLEGQWLFVVNAGSDEISSFRVLGDGGLELVDMIASGGRRPISLTQHGRVLYVLNAGGLVGDSDRISGFTIGSDGELSPISGSAQPLSAASTDPAQVGFTPDGGVLIVTEKATNRISTYVVDEDGRAGAPQSQPSAGAGPFGFAVGRKGLLFVSETFGGTPGASALSSYEVSGDGDLDVIDPSEPSTQTAACWVVLSKDGRFAYTTNTGSDTISAFEIDRDGELDLEDASAGQTGAMPIDVDFSSNGRFLYSLDSGDGRISAFRRSAGHGDLDFLQAVEGLPAGSNGLVAR